MSHSKIKLAHPAFCQFVAALLSCLWMASNVRDPARGINRSPEGFGGPPGWNGAMFLMCDGSVKFLSENTDLSVMKALATPTGGETNPDDSALPYPE